MQFVDYQQRLRARLQSNFDFQEACDIGGVLVDLAAAFKRTTERYVLLKKNIQYRYDTYEYFYLIHRPEATLDEVRGIVNQLTEHLVRTTPHDDEHMSSDHTIIFHVRAIDPALADYVRKFIFRRLFKLGFKGWIHIGLVLVDTTGQIIYSKHRKQKPYRFLDIKF